MPRLHSKTIGAAICIAFGCPDAQVLAQVLDYPLERIMVDPRRNTSSTNMSRDRTFPDERRWTAGTNMSRERLMPDERRSTAANNMVRERELADEENARHEKRMADAQQSARAARWARGRLPELNPDLAPERVSAIRKAEREKKQP